MRAVKTKITKRAIDGVRSGSRDVFLWDTEVQGFGCKITPKGRRVFVLQYWSNNRARRVTLGLYGSELTVDEARTSARRLRGQVASGGDPATDRARSKDIPTFAEVAERYLAEHAKPKKKPDSYKADARNLRMHILPALGRLRVDSVTRADVARLHAAMCTIPVQGNRCLALLSKIFNLTEAWGLRPDGSNPTRHVEKYRERKVERFLSREEFARLGRVLEEAESAGEDISAVMSIRLLVFTGCRRNEILALRWDQVDLQNRCLRLSETKTGSKVVPLGRPALDLLKTLPRVDENPYVLPGKLPKSHFVGLAKAWYRLRARAGLEGVRLHDLRHSFASMGAGTGESLVIIGALLGHRQPATTQRYAHLGADSVWDAADRISGQLAAALKQGAHHRTNPLPGPNKPDE